MKPLGFLMFVAVLALPIWCTDMSTVGLQTKFHSLSPSDFFSNEKSACKACHIEKKSMELGGINLAWGSAVDNLPVNIADGNKKWAADRASVMCLGCHDGSIGSMVQSAPKSPCGINPNLPPVATAANHPVFIGYNETKNLHPRSNFLQGIWTDAKTVGDLLREEKVVCISCHIPHHNDESGYLRTSNRGSALCFGCHKK